MLIGGFSGVVVNENKHYQAEKLKESLVKMLTTGLVKISEVRDFQECFYLA